MTWLSTAAAQQNLQELISDGPTDKYCDQKKVFGQVNGTNLQFKTFEFRRATNFTSSTWPLGVYVNGVPVSNANIQQDDIASGNFQFASGQAPADGSVVTASYYYQWFLSTELDQFLQNASTWLQLGATYINIPDGLNAAALRFAAQECYLKAAMKYSVRAAQTYKLEDVPNEDVLKAVSAFQAMAKDYMASAEKMRDDYYTRSGAALAPNSAIATGSVVDPVPRR